VIGVLLCAAGAFAGLSMVLDFAGHVLAPRPEVLLIPVGLGLLKGRRSSQRWAAGWIGLGLGATLLFGVMAVWVPSDVRASFFGYSFTAAESSVGFAALMLACIALLGWMEWALYSKPVRDYIHAREHAEDPVQSEATAPEQTGTSPA
jgi:hypothetical protein